MAAKPTRRKRNDLTLKQKYELIKESEKNPTLTTTELAGIYACGKTQVYQILKDKTAINSNSIIIKNYCLQKNVYRIIERTSECNNFEYSEQKLLYSIILSCYKETSVLRTPPK